MRRTGLGLLIALYAGVLFAGFARAQSAPKPVAAKVADVPVVALPDWLFPIDPVSLHQMRNPPKDPPKLDDKEPLTIPGSDVSFTLARINDRFNAPDWRPGSHGPMPDVVAKGRKPDVSACAFCHTPTGQGRPENAALAGLPEAYLRQQLLAYRSGARKPVGPAAYVPGANMQAVAKALTDKEIDESAKYFAPQKLLRRVWVVESLNIPRAEPEAWIYKEVEGTEELGDRLLEVTSEMARHERRDDRLEYTAYVPPGSLMRGKLLVTKGDSGKTQICATCHLANLRGTDTIPPINGRSPTYVLRQLLAFKNGLRTNAEAAQMKPVVEKLELDDMIAIAAYLGSLYP